MWSVPPWSCAISAATITASRAVLESSAPTTTVSNIDHIESQSLNGVSVIKVYLQPQANVDGALAEVTSEAEANEVSAADRNQRCGVEEVRAEDIVPDAVAREHRNGNSEQSGERQQQAGHHE